MNEELNKVQESAPNFSEAIEDESLSNYVDFIRPLDESANESNSIQGNQSDIPTLRKKPKKSAKKRMK